MGYSFRLAARVLLYAPSHRQDSTYHSLCYTSRGALAGTRNLRSEKVRYYIKVSTTSVLDIIMSSPVKTNKNEATHFIYHYVVSDI